MKTPIKTGLLAFGMSGKIFHAPFLELHDGFELAAVVERGEKKAHLTVANASIKSYGSVEELCADAEIELVVVNTPNATHFGFAMQALHAGKSVLMEKPFTVTVAEAEKLFTEAKKRKLHILTYQNRRFDTDFLSVKKVLDAGKLGRLVEVHFRFDRYRHHIGPKVAKESRVPGAGLLYDLGPHLLDQVISTFGIPVKWTKTLGHFRPETMVDDFAHIHLTYPDEVQVFVTMSMLVASAQPAFVIHGTRGSYVKQRADLQEVQLLEGILPSNSHYGTEEADKEGILTVISESGEKTQEKIASLKSSYIAVFDAVYQTIRENKPYYVTEEQVLMQLKILEG